MSGPTLFGAAAVPLITGLVQAAKTAGLPRRLAPVAGIALGLAAGLLIAWETNQTATDWAAGAILGITWGLSASGLYEAGSRVTQALNGRGNPYGPHLGSPEMGEAHRPLPHESP